MSNEPSSGGTESYREFAEFLHDQLGPVLTAIGLKLDLLRMEYQEDERLSARIRDVQTTLEDVIDEVRAYSSRLGPPRQ